MSPTEIAYKHKKKFKLCGNFSVTEADCALNKLTFLICSYVIIIATQFRESYNEGQVYHSNAENDSFS